MQSVRLCPEVHRYRREHSELFLLHCCPSCGEQPGQERGCKAEDEGTRDQRYLVLVTAAVPRGDAGSLCLPLASTGRHDLLSHRKKVENSSNFGYKREFSGMAAARK